MRMRCGGTVLACATTLAVLATTAVAQVPAPERQSGPELRRAEAVSRLADLQKQLQPHESLANGLDEALAVATEYRKLEDRLVPRPHTLRVFECWGAVFQDDGNDVATEGERLLGQIESRGAFASLARLGQHRRFVQPVTIESLKEPLTHVGRFMGLTQAAVARMRVLARRGDVDGYTETLDGVLALGQAQLAWPSTVPYLCAIGQQHSLALNAVRRDILAGRLNAGACQIIRSTIEGRPLPSPVPILEIERLIAMDEIDAWFDRSAAAFHANGPDGVDPDIAAAREESIRLLNRWIDAMVLGFSDDPADQERAGRELGAVERLLEPTPFTLRFRVLKDVLPPPFSLRDAWRGHRVLRDGIRIMLCLEQYRSEHGNYPDDLAALSPALLPELPPDPCRPGSPLVYRRLDPATAESHGRGYLLYSVGRDGIDDGGKPAANTLDALKSWRQNNVDYVINQLDTEPQRGRRRDSAP